jgi:hypothetical protein
MDSDPPKIIPVPPFQFKHSLTHFAHSLTRGKPKIVAIGSSSTAGEGNNIKPYPDRLLLFFTQLKPEIYVNPGITVVNEGIRGQEAPSEFERFDTDVIAQQPDLVIWQVGTNAVWQEPDVKPPPFSFKETIKAIDDGLIKLRKQTRADVILMDLQYLPAVLTPAKKKKAFDMVEAIGNSAGKAKNVNVFRRFEFMKGLYEVEQVSFDRMVDPGDETRLHQSDWATDRVAKAVAIAIIDGVNKAWA